MQPKPMSMRIEPSRRSSAVRVARDAATGANTISSTATPASLMAFSRVRTGLS